MNDWNINGSNLTKKQKQDLNDQLALKGFDVASLGLGAKLYLIRNNLTSIPKCQSCDKQLAYHPPSCGYRTYCSAKCSANSNNTINKRRETNLVKYGTINVLTKDLKQRKEKQFEKTYCDFSRFDTKVVPVFQITEFRGKCSRTEYEWLCKRCDKQFLRVFLPYLQKWPKCPTCDGVFTDIEDVIKDFLEKRNIEFRTHYRKIIQGYELDFFIPSLQLAIETSGLFYHTERFFPDKNYHKTKTNLCLDKKIKLIQIFSDELYLNPKACLARLKSLLGVNRKINGRKCIVQEVSTKQCCKFLDKYHTQGSDKATVRYGLFYKNRLVSVMTFCKLRKVLGQSSIEGKWELSRFVTINGFSVRGGFQKLLSKFIRNYQPNTIISYCDKRWSPDPLASVYARSGFRHIYTSEPNYWYVGKFRKRLHRANFQKHMLLKKHPEFDKTMTEKQIMEKLGYSRIWDCGHHKFQIDFVDEAKPIN
jgi:hypothetical protein